MEGRDAAVCRTGVVEGGRDAAPLQGAQETIIDGGPQCCPMPRWAGKEWWKGGPRCCLSAGKERHNEKCQWFASVAAQHCNATFARCATAATQIDGLNALPPPFTLASTALLAGPLVVFVAYHLANPSARSRKVFNDWR